MKYIKLYLIFSTGNDKQKHKKIDSIPENYKREWLNEWRDNRIN